MTSPFFCSPVMMSTNLSSYSTPTSSSIHTVLAARENGWWCRTIAIEVPLFPFVSADPAAARRRLPGTGAVVRDKSASSSSRRGAAPSVGGALEALLDLLLNLGRERAEV